ncbi:MAG: type VI secretion system baseplate subunit TssF [Labilithrix sp.]|nr:type VI secretion system baseplate subunit TssF [Labilithrix sp.]MCW5811434.1 type VI secretion system baseplate subunit TssF [Labilithrix sp.]
MSDFNHYYQDELAYLRELGREFAAAHPALAPMLAERSGDPDVERLLEGVAFLTGRVRQKLDDELPHAIQGIAQLLFPDVVRPMPSAAILELTPLPTVLRERMLVPAGTEFASVKVDGTPCTFRSTSDCELMPWVIDDVRATPLAGGKYELRIDLKMPLAMPIAPLGADRVRLHFAGETRRSLSLLTWVQERVESAAIRAAGPSGDRDVDLGRNAVRSVGFEANEALLPAPTTAFAGPRLLEEYYALPAKFAFVDVVGLARLGEISKTANRFSIVLRLDSPPPADVRVDRDAIALHCVPIVNVFAATAEPLAVRPAKDEYLVRPAGFAPGHAEVYAITQVEAIAEGGSRAVLSSFYDFSYLGGAAQKAFYAAHVRPSVVGGGADTVISFGTARDSGVLPDAEAISIDLLATNRSLARAIRAGEICVPTASSPAVATFRNLAPPTAYVPPPFGRDQQWRVVAHAAMNLSAITDVNVLRAALDVYNFHARVDAQAARSNELRLAALQRVKVSPADQLHRGVPVRGVAIDIEVADSGFTGAGDMYLFGAVLDRFFASYVSINSFTRVSLEGTPSRHRFTWPARSGSSTLT